MRLERRDLWGLHFELYLAASPCLCDIVPSDLKLASRRKLVNDFISFTKSAKWINFPRDFPRQYLHCYHFRLAQNNTAREQPEPRAIVNRLAGNRLDKISYTEWHHENAVWCWELFKMLATINFWASLETNFKRKTCTWNLGERLNLVGGFY